MSNRQMCRVVRAQDQNAVQRQVAEMTLQGWDINGAVKSKMDRYGARSYEAVMVRKLKAA